MNNSKIWLVVKPTVGIPLFLSAVAVGSFAVHVAVLSNTTWVADFLAGRELGATAQAASAAPAANAGAVGFVGENSVALDTLQDGDAIKVVLADGRTARLVIDRPPERLADASAAPPGAR